MLYSHIKADLSQSPFFQSLPAHLNSGKRVQIHHLNQSARALVAAHLWAQSGKNVIIVSQDDIIAEDIWDDLCALIGRDNAHYLPDYEILPYEERSPHYSIRATRMLCLYNAMSEIPAIYSLSVRALLRYIPPKASIARHIIHIRQGMEYPPDKLILDLHNSGYQMEYQVSKVYQAARRGGIIDVFSPPLLKPVRIEFFGDEIVSMRSFSANSQRSEPGELNEVTLIPARELCLDDIDHHSPLASRIKTKGFYDGIENQLSLLLPELETFADYFDPDNRIMLMSNFNYVMEEVQQLGEQILSQYQKELKHKTKAKLSSPERLMAGEEYIYKLLRPDTSAFLSQSEFVLPFATDNLKAPFEPQPAFGGDLDLLASHLKNNAHQRRILLFDNPSQSKRMDQLLDDFDVKAEHHIGVLHEGFSITDAGLTLWTDHEIFNRYKRKRY
ncbi:MAG: transcription-repair coupling factor, partial [Candidatus Cloacimonadaceae bacterium]|nr:transcription-repair coupling factor [Candidatus Cloacimonadaceae bacterium]